MADTGGVSDYEILQATRPQERPASGWGAVGNALGGGGTIAGQNAYQNGMRVGAQTADALAQARQRIQENQGRTNAAAAVRNPQFQTATGLDPAVSEAIASRIEAGQDPASITNLALEAQKKTLIDRVAGGGNAGRLAAAALAPGSAGIKAEGANGTFVDPFSSSYSSDTPGGPTNTPVTVGPQQSALDQSEIDLRGAQAKAAGVNAGANATRASTTAANAGANKPPTNMRWKMNDDNSDYALDETGRRIAEPVPGAPQKGEGAYQGIYSSNMVGSAGQLAKELHNVSAIGITSNAGLTGFGPGHGGVMATLSDNLGKSLSGEDQLMYHKSLQNVGRMVGMLENGGRATTKGAAGSAQEAIEAQAADTPNSAMYGLAIARQAAEAQIDRMSTNGAPPAKIEAYKKAVTEITKAIPFTPLDVINFSRAPKGQKFQDWLRANGEDAQAAGGAASGAAAPGQKQDLGGGWSVVQH